MAVEVVKSVLLTGKLGERLNRAFNDAKKAELKDSGFGSLPAGMNAIAQLKECRFRTMAEGKENAGSPYFYATGRIVSPKTFTDAKGNVHLVEGEITTLMEVIADTPDRTRKTIEAHFSHVIAHMKALMKFVPMRDKMLTDIRSVEKVVQFITQLKPYFKLSTFKGQAPKVGKWKDTEPRVQELWKGAVQYTPELNVMGRTQDDTESVDEQPLTDGVATSRSTHAMVQVPGMPQNRPATPNGAQVKSPPAKPSSPVQAPAKAPVQDEPQGDQGPVFNEEGGQEPFNEFGDVDALVERSNHKDKDAQLELARLAEKQGYSKQEINKAEDWATIGKMALTPKGTEQSNGEEELGAVQTEDEGQEVTDEPTEDEESQEPQFPAVEMVCHYKPYNSKTKKYEQTAVECVIKGINTEEQTADLINLADGKTLYKGCNLDKLIPME